MGEKMMVLKAEFFATAFEGARGGVLRYIIYL
jgi:hypothetical protein